MSKGRTLIFDGRLPRGSRMVGTRNGLSFPGERAAQLRVPVIDADATTERWPSPTARELPESLLAVASDRGSEVARGFGAHDPP